MNFKTALLGLFFLTTSALAHAQCDGLQNAGLTIGGLTAGTYVVNAGDILTLPVQLQVANPTAWADLDSVDLQFTASLATPEGAAPLYEDVVLFAGNQTQNLPNSLQFRTTAAMAGTYTLSVYYVGSGCGYGIALPAVQIFVKNSAANVDLEGPVINDVRVKSAYKLKDPMTFEVTASDKSPICVVGLLGLMCKTTATVTFDDVEGFILVEAKVSASPKPNVYVLSFVSGFWQNGKYPILSIELQDKWGNETTKLSPALQKIFNVQ